MSINNPPLLPGVALALYGTVVQGPAGPQGSDGLSSYQLWLDEGNTGTINDFLLTLIGPPGDDGRPVELQKSAIHIQWRYQGDIGWTNLVPLVDLKGDPGNDGVNGTNGTNGIDGLDGADGRGIVSIVRTAGTGAAGTVDTYTITYTTGPTSTFDVTNGANGTNGIDGTDGVDGNDGRGIVSVVRTSGTGAAGTTDTYTITFTDASTSTFNVYNGADGGGAGDMTKAIYDSDDDGKVNAAEVADAAPWTGITGKPTFGTASGLNVPAAGNAATNEIVKGDDTRLSDARAPTAHSHGTGEVTGLNTALTALSDHLGATTDAHSASAIVNTPAGNIAATTVQAALNELDSEKEPALPAGGTADQYLRGNKTWADLPSAVRAAVLTGFTASPNSAVVAGDTVLQAIGKLQAQVSGVSGGGGLTTVHVTGATATYTAAVGENVSIESTVAVTSRNA